MALPSSPPMLPETDLPTSPPLLSIASAGIHSSAFDRKRPRSDYGSLSSDPIFSDTTSDADEPADLQQPKRKRLVRGPWWNVGKQSRQDLRRGMAKKEGLRNADSGVWMGSDSSDGSMDSIVSSQQRMQDLAVDEYDETVATHDPIAADVKEERMVYGEALASKVIQRCVDVGKESVDLSDIGLTTLSDDTLKPLHHLIRQTFADFTHPPSEDEFTPLTPDLKVFLSRNQLTTLPRELFNLTNISVLSLRSNELTELPPAIARLHHLEELNIAGNNIRHLPWELLGLIHAQGKRRQITVRPNPLIEPDLGPAAPRTWGDTHGDFVNGGGLTPIANPRQLYEELRRTYEEHGTLSARLELEMRLGVARSLMYPDDQARHETISKSHRQELVYLASSEVEYFGVDGRRRRSGSRMLSLEPDYAVVLESTPRGQTAAPNGAGPPSMFELALRGAQSHYNLQDLVSQLGDSDLSPGLTSAIRTAASNVRGHGNEACSTCARGFVVSRAEWMEYWFYGSMGQTLMTENVLPFLRKACSWACARPSEIGEYRCWS